MAVLLVFLALAAFACAGAAWMRDGRMGALAGATAWAAFLAACTEVLGALNALTDTGLAVAWAGAVAMAAGTAWFVARRRGLPAFGLAGAGWFERLALGCAAAIAAATLLVALAAPATTFDSLTYHMSRVMHWLQNGTVAHYPTHIDRQLFLEPFAEFVILHFSALSGGDRLANVPQWLAFVGSVMTASVIARELGGGPRAQVLAAVVCATAPLAILQASSSQNDLMAGFWLACAAAFGLRCINRARAPRDSGRPAWLDLALFGAAMGLGLLTKPTNRMYLLPVLALVTLALLWRYRARAVVPLGLAAAAVIALNAGHIVRNYELFGPTLLPAARRSVFFVRAGATGAFTANFIRNTLINFALPRADLNRSLLSEPFLAVAEVLNLRTSDGRTHTLEVSDWAFDDGVAGNPLHLLAFWASLAAVFAHAPLRRDRLLPAYAMWPVTGFVLLSAILAWTPFHTRYQLGLMILAAPLIGVVADRLPHRRLAIGMCVVMLLVAILPTVRNNSRPLVGRRSVLSVRWVDQAFLWGDIPRPTYARLARRLLADGCDTLGLITGVDTAEYTLWLGARAEGWAGRIVHVNVTNESARTADRHGSDAGRVCAVAVIRADQEATLDVSGRRFSRVEVDGLYSLYLPD